MKNLKFIVVGCIYVLTVGLSIWAVKYFEKDYEEELIDMVGNMSSFLHRHLHRHRHRHLLRLRP